MATTFTKHALSEKQIEVIKFSITGSDIEDKEYSINGHIFHLIKSRDIYARGTIDSIFYLNEKIKIGARGKVFSMIDVLKNTLND